MARLPTPVVRGLIALHFPANEVESGMRIAWRESNFDPITHNDNWREGGRDDSYGLFQINMLGNLGEDRRRRWGILVDQMLFDPNFNVAIARKLWDENGGSWTGSQAWMSIPTTRNYPTTGDNQQEPGSRYDPSILEGLVAKWLTEGKITQQEYNIWLSIPLTDPNDSTYDIRAYYYMNYTRDHNATGMRRDGLSDQQWEVVKKITRMWKAAYDQGLFSDIADAIGSAGNNVGDNLPSVLNPLEWLKVLGKFFNVLLNPDFWKRVGLGVLAVGVIILAFVMFNKEQITGALKK